MIRINRRTLVLAGYAYLIFLVYLLFFAPFRQYTLTAVNFVPFKSIIEVTRLHTFTTPEGAWHWFVNVPGNIVAFIPLPFIFRLFYSKPVQTWLIILITSTLPALIELIQYIFQRGSCDIDDWILNICGLLIGIWCITLRQKKATNKI